MAVPETELMLLALYDFVPVALGSLGALFVARRLNRTMAYIGAAMVAAGGVGKAVAKLLSALGAGEFDQLSGMLFPMMGCGLIILAAGAWECRINFLGWCCIALAALGIAVPNVQGWYLIAVIGGTTTLYLALGRHALRERDSTTLVLLVMTVATYLLGNLARSEQTVSLQWIEQTLNTVGQGAFAAAAVRQVSGHARAGRTPGAMPSRGTAAPNT
ncbi:hypothetical protein FK268_13650 [Tsukamurella sputi]|uniref:Uncharacterized protein n=1 Tax=Tsukamurella sputi TaxID=2591848 RepID=A0A5C5RJY7_9ACTN|nr:hypothetical protein [Tsukamurella sputi]TWS23336.1 hypothetical protein FK268_13650 [Tsukamurella sputi]